MLLQVSFGGTPLDLQVELPSQPLSEPGGVVDVDLARICEFVPDLPNLSWSAFTNICWRTVAPAYQHIHQVVCDDFDRVAYALSQIEQDDPQDDPRPQPAVLTRTPGSPIRSNRDIGARSDFYGVRRPKQQCRQRSRPPIDHPLILPSKNRHIPTITITPCPSPSREVSSRVPYQDNQFNTRLVIPGYPLYNSTFPPMLPPSYENPQHQEWLWQNGHWRSIVPSLRDQAERGKYSRPLSNKRRTLCSPKTPFTI